LAEVITCFLEMHCADDVNAVVDSRGLSVIEAEIDNFRLNRFLYEYVGEPWQWVEKLEQSDAQWRDYVEDPGLRTWVAYCRGSIAGYFELSDPGDGNVEIVYFGLAPAFIGQGFGGYLLSCALQAAWAMAGAKRVWLHTCSLDHPNAVKNYEARGMTMYRQERSSE
jgi:GNAT superfamily N-acetyltransferase